MNTKHFLRVSCLSLAAVLPQSAFADDERPAEKTPEQIFKELDKNGDGRLTADEMTGDQKPHFERMLRVADKDKSGDLTKEEFLVGFKAEERNAAPGRPGGGRGEGRGEGARRFDPAQMFDNLDKNKDGKLTKDEIPDQRPMIQRIFEKSGKAELTREEFLKLVQETRPGGDRAAGGENLRERKPEDVFKNFDANRDGKLTVDEVPEFLQRGFEEMLEKAGKKKEDGLTQDEFVKGLAERRAADERRPDGERGPDPRAQGGPGGRDAGPRGRDGGPQGREGGPRGREGGPQGREGGPQGRDGGPRGFPPDSGLRKLDTNGDGKLSKAELSKIADMFDELDLNKDGFLDMLELMGPPPDRREGGPRGEGGPRQGGGRPGGPDGKRPERSPAGGPPDGKRGERKPADQRSDASENQQPADVQVAARVAVTVFSIPPPAAAIS